MPQEVIENIVQKQALLDRLLDRLGRGRKLVDHLAILNAIQLIASSDTFLKNVRFARRIGLRDATILQALMNVVTQCKEPFNAVRYSVMYLLS